MQTELEMGVARDWRKALRSPPAYRIVNRTLQSQRQFIVFVVVTGALVLMVLYLFPSWSRNTNVASGDGYNYTYPLTNPIITQQLRTFRIGIIADLDTNSKSKTEKSTWYSYLKKGYLSYNPLTKSVVVTWDKADPIRLTTQFSLKDRGLELSELVVFDGRLLTFDDRTGIVFEIVGEKVYPWQMIMDGNGMSTKGFKAEWATVKDQKLYIGSMGKEWTTASGEFESYNPMYIKELTTAGQVTHVNWISEYKRIRSVLGIDFPGYMIHESGHWSEIHRKWFFLPRRCSVYQYNETLDERRGCSVLITADSDVYNVKSMKIPNSDPTKGFSSFKFVPTTDDSVIVALRTEELEGKTATYITAFDTEGKTLMDNSFVSDLKYEGLEFI